MPMELMALDIQNSPTEGSITVSNELDPVRVQHALRKLITDLDYDLHKQIECDEETGDDSYPILVEGFINDYNEMSN